MIFAQNFWKVTFCHRNIATISCIVFMDENAICLTVVTNMFTRSRRMRFRLGIYNAVLFSSNQVDQKRTNITDSPDITIFIFVCFILVFALAYAHSFQLIRSNILQVYFAYLLQGLHSEVDSFQFLIASVFDFFFKSTVVIEF